MVVGVGGVGVVKWGEDFAGFCRILEWLVWCTRQGLLNRIET